MDKKLKTHKLSLKKVKNEESLMRTCPDSYSSNLQFSYRPISTSLKKENINIPAKKSKKENIHISAKKSKFNAYLAAILRLLIIQNVKSKLLP